MAAAVVGTIKLRQMLHLRAVKPVTLYELKTQDLEEISFKHPNLKKELEMTKKKLVKYDYYRKEWAENCPKFDYICSMPAETSTEKLRKKEAKKNFKDLLLKVL